jgi:hypothetical protein
MLKHQGLKCISDIHRHGQVRAIALRSRPRYMGVTRASDRSDDLDRRNITSETGNDNNANGLDVSVEVGVRARLKICCQCGTVARLLRLIPFGPAAVNRQ